MSKARCVDQALLFIEENLKQKITLEDIADAANLSQWYFHRLFRIATGFCVSDYLRRRRICEASHVLLYTTTPLRVLAQEYQFESQEAFTRSFSEISGFSPGRFRKLLAPLVQFPALCLDTKYHYLKKGETMTEPRFERKEAFTVVGVHTVAKTSDTLHQLWGEFMHRAGEISKVICPDKAYQVCVLKGSTPETDEYTFIAGMAVSSGAEVPQGMMEHLVPAADYAVFEHRGTLEKLHQSYEYIFGIWLQESGYHMAEADSLEVYDQRFIPDSADSLFEIWVPIIKS